MEWEFEKNLKKDIKVEVEVKKVKLLLTNEYIQLIDDFIYFFK